jgi:DNA-binding NarL/FixJ family response regulator
MTDVGSNTVRVLVVDDQRLMREGIASLLDIQPGLQVVGTAGNGQEALAQAAALEPDVVLMDVRMPVMDGVTAAAALKQQRPGCVVLMLTTFDDEDYVVKALQAGARGYLLKDTPAADLAQAIRLAQAGIYQLDPGVAGKLVGGLGPAPAAAAPSPAVPLTERELGVLRLIARGATNREIAEKLVISEGTVKNHISSILSRLGLRDRTEAAIYAHQHRLI